MVDLQYDNRLISVELVSETEGIKEYEVVQLEKDVGIQISFSLPAVNVANTWHATKGSDSSLKADWSAGHTATIAQSAPVETFYDYSGQNVLTVAWDEIINKVIMRSGIHEEDGSLVMNMLIPKISEEATRLLIITKEYPYSDALLDVTHWWEEKLEIFPVSDWQRLPMYSTWYAFHQEVTAEGLRKEVPHIKALGMDTIIIDDGWQTEDTNRGYAFCGDWEVAPSKFADFKQFVDEMHEEEMKIMIWFSVPFVGIKSNKWEQVKDKLLMYSESLEAGIIDIRYQENIDFVVQTYKDFIEKYPVDGLKLDFIDQFVERPDSPKYHTGMQYETVEEALAILMDQIKEVILAHDPEFFIEFRQRYIGPKMREYSNAFRVTDCPYSAIRNRVGIADLRMISGDTPVHSDMLLWHREDHPENIALQLAASIFSVIQLSVKLANQTEEQLATIDFYTEFAKEHVELLQLSSLTVTEPENLYSTVTSSNETQEIIALYSEQQIVQPEKAETWIINGNAQSSVHLKIAVGETRIIEVYNAQGQLQGINTVNEDLTEIAQYPGGITKISLQS